MKTAKPISGAANLMLVVALSLLAAIPAMFISCERGKREPWEKEPLTKDPEVTRMAEAPNLFLERVRFHSAEMQETRFFLVLVPKTSQPISEVFILNHGWYDRPRSLLDHLKVDQVYGQLLAEGKVRPALVVMPYIHFPDFFREYSSEILYPNYLTLVGEEVSRTVSQHYRIPFDRQRWSIGGFSFGGLVSLDVARRFPGRFGKVSVVSSFYDPNWRYWPKDQSQTPPDKNKRNRDTVMEPGPPPLVYLACGEKDHFYGTMKILMSKLEGEFGNSSAKYLHWYDVPGGHYEGPNAVVLGAAGNESGPAANEKSEGHTWKFEKPEGHTWEFWSSVLPRMLRAHLGPGEEGKELK